jgi:hypothetical protein
MVAPPSMRCVGGGQVAVRMGPGAAVGLVVGVPAGLRWEASPMAAAPKGFLAGVVPLMTKPAPAAELAVWNSTNTCCEQKREGHSKLGQVAVVGLDIWVLSSKALPAGVLAAVLAALSTPGARASFGAISPSRSASLDIVSPSRSASLPRRR